MNEIRKFTSSIIYLDGGICKMLTGPQAKQAQTRSEELHACAPFQNFLDQFSLDFSAPYTIKYELDSNELPCVVLTLNSASESYKVGDNPIENDQLINIFGEGSREYQLIDELSRMAYGPLPGVPSPRSRSMKRHNDELPPYKFFATTTPEDGSTIIRPIREESSYNAPPLSNKNLQTIQTLETQITQLQSNIDALTKQQIRQEEVVQEQEVLTRENKQLKSQLEEQRTKVETLTTQNKQDQAQLQKVQQQFAQSQSDLALAQAACTTKQDQSRIMERELAIQATDIQLFMALKEIHAQENEQLKHELKTTQHTQAFESEQMQEEMSSVKGRIVALLADKISAQTRLSQVQATHEQLMERLEREKSESLALMTATTEEMKRSLKRERDIAQQELTHEKQKWQRSTEKLNEKIIRLESANHRAAQEKERLAQPLEDASAQLRSQNERLLREKEALEKLVAESQKIEGLQAENDSLRETHRHHLHHLSGLESKVRQLETSVTAKGREKEELLAENSSQFRKQIEKIEKQRASAHQSLAQLETRYSELETDNETMLRRLRGHQRQDRVIARLRAENAQLQEQMEQFEGGKKAGELFQESQALRVEVEGWYQENTRLRQANEELQAELEAFKQAIALGVETMLARTTNEMDDEEEE